MRTLQSMLATMSLVVGLGLATTLVPAPAAAVDNMEPTRPIWPQCALRSRPWTTPPRSLS
jgi:hypothetical protein